MQPRSHLLGSVPDVQVVASRNGGPILADLDAPSADPHPESPKALLRYRKMHPLDRPDSLDGFRLEEGKRTPGAVKVALIAWTLWCVLALTNLATSVEPHVTKLVHLYYLSFELFLR